MKTVVLIAAAVAMAVVPLYSQQANTTLEGTLQIQWGDPPSGLTGGKTLYSLLLADGTRVPLQLRSPASEASFYFGKRVTVSGRVVLNQFDATQTFDPLMMVVDSLSPAAQPAAQAAVFGTRKVIYLLLKFSDDSAVPHAPVFYTDLNNPDTPPAGEVFPATVNGFFKKTSWNQFFWIGDVGGVGGLGASGGWLTLPHPKSYYAPCNSSSSCAKLQEIADDGTALGRAEGISFSSYENINFVLSNDLDCCAWGGTYHSSVDNKTFGATWEPPWGQDAGIYSHEMGHSLGLPHSGWVYYAYDSPWDIMSSSVSATTVACGSYFSRNSNTTKTLNCTEPGDGYNASYKDYLGWIPALNSVTTTTGSALITTLEADTLALTSLAKIVKICISGLSCTGSNAHYFTVEARVKGMGTTSQYDNGIPGEGIVIHEFQRDRLPVEGTCYFNNQSGWAWPIDSTPGDYDSVNCNFGGRSYPNYGLYNAQWSAGQTYTNKVYGFVVQVVSRSGSTFVVNIGPRKRLGQMVSQ